jgi:hypothetical protein
VTIGVGSWLRKLPDRETDDGPPPVGKYLPAGRCKEAFSLLKRSS